MKLNSALAVGQIVKLFWMAFWRLVIVAMFVPYLGTNFLLVLVLALTFALVTVLAFERTLPTFPLLRAIFRRGQLFNPVRQTSYSGQLLPQKSSAPWAGRPAAQQASIKVAPSGYEPASLRALPVPQAPAMFGKPGAGLAQATQFGSKALAGVVGEENFAKALAKTGLLQRCESYWSVAMPTAAGIYPDPNLPTDIDCVLVAGHNVFLVDLKYYKSGHVAYYTHGQELAAIDLANGALVGSPHSMSRNMAIAHERFSKHFSNFQVTSVVVFMPTDAGEATVSGVYWPGHIPALRVSDFIAHLEQALPRVPPTYQSRPGVALTSLLKS